MNKLKQILSVLMVAATAVAVLGVPATTIAQEGHKSKSAFNRSQGVDAATTIARSGDRIEYTLLFDNTTVNSQNVAIEDDISDVLQLADVENYNGASLSGSTLRFPAVYLGSGWRLERTFVVRIKDFNSLPSDRVMTNIYGNTVSVQVAGSDQTTNSGSTTTNAPGGRSKTSYNQTQNRNAQSVFAQPGDFILYTLTYRNTSGSTQTVAIEDDINDVLSLADITNLGGGSVNGNILRFPSVEVPYGSQIDRQFQVRVRSIPAGTLDTMMSNYYGNGIDIRVATVGGYASPQANGTVKGAVYTAPATGPRENFALLFATLLTGGVYLYQMYRRRWLRASA